MRKKGIPLIKMTLSSHRLLNGVVFIHSSDVRLIFFHSVVVKTFFSRLITYTHSACTKW